MKKMLLMILISWIANCALAKTSFIKSSNSNNQEIFSWEFFNKDDGLYFILGPESDHSLPKFAPNFTH